MTNCSFHPLSAAGEERVGERSDAGVSLQRWYRSDNYKMIPWCKYYTIWNYVLPYRIYR